MKMESEQDRILQELGIDPVAYNASQYPRPTQAEAVKQPRDFPTQDELLRESRIT